MFLPRSVKQLPWPAQRIRFQELEFKFSAPYRTAKQAKERGIENRICRLGRAVCRPGDLAIDVGASYGFITLVLATHGVRVMSFEIEPRVVRVLRKNVRMNGARDVEVVPEGVGKDLFHLDSLDAVPRFLKVDTDGGDLSVLESGVQMLKNHHPVVVVEMCRFEEQIFDLLKDVGYRHFQGMSNEAVTGAPWPVNLIASVESVTIPEIRPVTSEVNPDEAGATKG